MVQDVEKYLALLTYSCIMRIYSIMSVVPWECSGGDMEEDYLYYGV